MKKLLKWALMGIGILVAIGTISVLFLSQKYPEGNSPAKADALAGKMMEALDKDGWDSLKYLSWNFADRQSYIWDKQGNKAIVKWDDVEVLINLDNQQGDVTVGGKILQEGEKESYLSKAWANWCNDSFWMSAPFKIFDPGTTRTIVIEEGKECLMVKYDGGGVTPGDSYLWILDDDNIPTAYKMWVKVIPIGGSMATWDKWITLPCGAKVSTQHDMKVFVLDIKDVKEGRSFKDFGYTSDPFVVLN